MATLNDPDEKIRIQKNQVFLEKIRADLKGKSENFTIISDFKTLDEILDQTAIWYRDKFGDYRSEADIENHEKILAEIYQKAQQLPGQEEVQPYQVLKSLK